MMPFLALYLSSTLNNGQLLSPQNKIKSLSPVGSFSPSTHSTSCFSAIVSSALLRPSRHNGYVFSASFQYHINEIFMIFSPTYKFHHQQDEMGRLFELLHRDQ